MPRLLSRRVAPALLAAGCAVAGVQAVELGDLRVYSSPGQQLRASISLAGADASDSEARCFNGTLLNPDGRQTGTLRVAFQRSAGGAMLLLAAAGTGTEAVAVLRMENVCGTGANREYPVTLVANSAVPAPALPAANAPAAAAPQAPKSERAENPGKAVKPGTAEKAQEMVQEVAEPPSKKLQKALAEEKALSRKLQSLEAKLATALSAADAGGLLRKADASASDTAPLVLKLERSLAVGVSAADAPASLATWTEAEVGALLLLLIACTGAGILFRLRQADTSKGQWMPADLA